MVLEELFENESGDVVNSKGKAVPVKLIGCGPKIVYCVGRDFRLSDYCDRAPLHADAFVKGDMTSISKLVASHSGHDPVYEFVFYAAVQYFKKS